MYVSMNQSLHIRTASGEATACVQRSFQLTPWNGGMQESDPNNMHIFSSGRRRGYGLSSELMLANIFQTKFDEEIALHFSFFSDTWMTAVPLVSGQRIVSGFFRVI